MPIQNLPAFFDMQFTNKEGKLSPDGYLYNDQTFQTNNLAINAINGITSTAVQNGTGTVTINGLTPPSKTTAEITTLAAIVSPTDPNFVPNGTIWYDSDLKKLKFKADTSVVELITST